VSHVQGTVIDEPSPEQATAPVDQPASTGPSWSTVESNPRYKQATPQQQAEVRSRYWDRYLSQNSKIAALDPTKQEAVRQKFVAAPKTTKPEPAPKAGGGESFATTLKNIPANFTSYVEGLISGGTMDLIDPTTAPPPMDTKLADWLTGGVAKQRVVKAMDISSEFLPTTMKPKPAPAPKTEVTKQMEATGKFVGQMLPITLSFKAARWAIGGAKTAAELTKAGVSAARVAVAEGALTGLIYEGASGFLHGKDIKDIGERAGETALTWGVLGGLIGQLSAFVGDKIAAKAAKRAAEELVKTQGAAQKEAELAVGMLRGPKGPQSFTVRPTDPKQSEFFAKLRAEAEGPKPAPPEPAPGTVIPAKPLPFPLTAQKPIEPLKQIEQGLSGEGFVAGRPAEPSRPWGPPLTEGGFQPGGLPKDISLLDKPVVPVTTAKVVAPTSRMALIKAAAERAKGKPEPIITIEPKTIPTKRSRKATVEELDVPLPPNVQMARPEKGLPIVEVTKEELEAEVRRSKMIPRSDLALSDEEQIIADGIKLYSGLPMDQVKGLIRLLRKKVDSRNATGEDLNLFSTLMRGLLSPSQMAKVNPVAESIVKTSIQLRSRVFHRGRFEYHKSKELALKGLSQDEKLDVMMLLNKADKISDIPPDVLVNTPDKVIKAFSKVRNNILDHIGHRLGIGKDPSVPWVYGYVPKIHAELVRGLTPTQQEQVIRTFAQAQGIPYETASKFIADLTKQAKANPYNMPKEAFFGPANRARIAEESKFTRIWDADFVLDYYIDGAMRKLYLDELMAEAKKLLPLIDKPETARVHSLVVGYLNRQRGLPAGPIDATLREIPWVAPATKLISWGQTISKLGLSPVQFLIQAHQYPFNNGIKMLGAMLRDKSFRGVKPFAEGLVAVFNKKSRAIVRRSGVLHTEGATDLPISDLPGTMDKISRIATSFTRWGDAYSRSAAYVQGFKELEKRMPGLGSLTLKEKRFLQDRAGVGMVVDTQFVTDVSDRQSLLINPAARVIGKFKPFFLKELEFFAHLDTAEWAAALVVMDLFGGPDAIPGLRQLYAGLREHHPDAPITKAMNGLQEFSLYTGVPHLAGLPAIDVGYVFGIGFIPGINLNADFWKNYTTNFWGTVGEEISGVTGTDTKNVIADFRTGYLSYKDPNIRQLLGLDYGEWGQKWTAAKNVAALDSASVVSAQLRRIARGLKELEDKHVEYSRYRKGPELTPGEAYIRAIGAVPQRLSREQQVTTGVKETVDDANRAKVLLEDRYLYATEQIGLTTTEKARESAIKAQAAVWDEITKFNEQRFDRGVMITTQTLLEAHRNLGRPLTERLTQSKLQLRIMNDKLTPYRRED